jgi:uncharacterized protein (TIGR02145 family)
MRNYFQMSVIIVLFLSLNTIMNSCKKEKELTPPLLTTATVSGITRTDAVSGGDITADGGASVTARGVCWGTANNPTVTGSHTSDGTGTGTFTSSISGLTAGTIYYVRAYATNSVGTAYGNEVSFTSTPVSLATLTTSAVTLVTSTTAESGGNITDDNGSDITVRGVCWGIAHNPTITDPHTSNGTGKGTFSSSITGLTAGTIYYVRAYATNGVGTAYGNEVSFTTTAASLATLTTTIVTSITATAAVSGGNITDDNGSNITAKGVSWGTAPNPTIAGSHTSDGTGTFSSSITGLTAGTIYYVRAYATNSAGTAYGNEVSFTSATSGGQTGTVTDIEGNIYITILIGTQTWMAENLKTNKYNDNTSIPRVTDNTDWANLTTPAFCWYNNEDVPTGNTYGALYNWYAVNTGNLCPAGWHVPTDTEWHTLILFVDPNATLSNPESLNAGNKLKESGTTHWPSPNTGATNESGFKALPGGSRDINGAFSHLGSSGYWWGSDNSTAWYREMDYNYSGITRVSPNQKNGFSVRCVKN